MLPEMRPKIAPVQEILPWQTAPDFYLTQYQICNMWASSRNNVEKGVKAGLPYAFFPLAQYIHPGAWAQGKLDRLRKALGEILDSPYADT
jgi:hypothetical protein